jgi:hypothetical protein
MQRLQRNPDPGADSILLRCRCELGQIFPTCDSPLDSHLERMVARCDMEGQNAYPKYRLHRGIALTMKMACYWRIISYDYHTQRIHITPTSRLLKEGSWIPNPEGDTSSVLSRRTAVAPRWYSCSIMSGGDVGLFSGLIKCYGASR